MAVDKYIFAGYQFCLISCSRKATPHFRSCRRVVCQECLFCVSRQLHVQLVQYNYTESKKGSIHAVHVGLFFCTGNSITICYFHLQGNNQVYSERIGQ